MAAIAGLTSTLVRKRPRPTPVVEKPLELTPTVTLSYTVNASVLGGHGSVNPASQTVNSGTDATITITPDIGYHIASITDNGGVVSVANPYVISNVTTNHTVVGTFATDNFTITASAGSGGSIAPSGMVTVNYGNDQVFTITQNTGYYVADVLVDGSSVGALTSLTFTNVATNHTVVVTFASAVRDLKIIPNRVKPGGIINIFAEATNTGSATSSFSLVLKVRGIVEAVKEVTLRPGQSQKVAFIVLRDKPGVYDVDLEGLKGSFTVER